MANKRIVTLGFLLAMAWLGMLGRVSYVQVVQGGYYQSVAYSQSIRRNILAPKRGEILDRDHNKLVMNAEVQLDPVGTESARGPSGRPGRKLNRLAPQGTLAGQVLGNVGRDGYGQLGLEYFLDRELRGTDGWKYIRHDVRNHYYPGFDENQKRAVNGTNVVLTLDSKLQEITEHALERGVRKAGARQGVAIVVDPWAGDILAMANYPFYNPNTRDKAEQDAWKNQAVAKVYEPGSTFKTFTAAALLEEKLIEPEDTLDGENGEYRIAGQIIRDTKPRGRISFRDALAYSSNICFAKASTRLRPETFYRYLRSFGFGMKTGVGLPAEESGFLKPVTEWSGRTQPTMAFGHEVSATPLQVAMAFAAVANGGTLMKPRMVKAWVDDAGKVTRDIPSRAVRRVMSEPTAALVKGMLEAVVAYGTAADIRSDRIPMAGKTGTAEKIDAETGLYVKGRFNSSFAGMAPVARPDIVCLVLLDEPTMLKHGGQSAAPIFREIVERMANDPDYPLGRHAPVASAGAGTAGGEEAAAASAAAPDLLDYAEGDDLPQDPRVMPDVTNGTLRDALLKLKGLGLDVEYTGTGRIIRQIPASGSPVAPGQKCVLTLGWMG